MCIHVHLPTISVDRFQTAHGPVVGQGLGAGDPCSKEQSGLIYFVEKYLTAGPYILLHILDFCIQKLFNARKKQRSVALERESDNLSKEM